MSFDASFRRSFESSDERSNALSFETSDARSNVTSFEMSDGMCSQTSSQVSSLRYFPANSETSFLASFGESNRGVEDWSQRPVSDSAGVEWRMSGGDRRLADEGETSPQRRRDTPYRLRGSWTVRV